jgi:hypothetical protein
MLDKIGTFSKLLSHMKKTTAYSSGIILDTQNVHMVNFRGHGFEMLHANTMSGSNSSAANSQTNLQESSDNLFAYPLLFSYPKMDASLIEHDKHIRNVIALIISEPDSKLKYFFDQVSRSVFIKFIFI